MPLEVGPGEISCMAAASQELSERITGSGDQGPWMGVLVNPLSGTRRKESSECRERNAGGARDVRKERR